MNAMDSFSARVDKGSVYQLKVDEIPREREVRNYNINTIDVDKPSFIASKHNEYVIGYINVILSALIQANLQFKRDGSEVDDAFSDFLQYTPTASENWVDFASSLLTNYLIYNNAFALIIKTGLGRDKIKRLVVIANDLVQVDRNPETDEVIYTISGMPGVVNSHNMIHLRGATVDGLNGFNFTRNATNLKNLNSKMDESLHKKMGKNNSPFYIDSEDFRLDPDDPETQALMAFYNQMRANYNSGESIVVNNKQYSDLKQLKDEPHYFDVAAISRMIERRVALMLNIPFQYLSDAGGEDAYKALVTQTITPILTRFENELTRKLLTRHERMQGYRIEFDRLSLLRADLKTISTASKDLIRSAVVKPDEIRKILGLNPIGGIGDRIHLSRDLLDDEEIESLKTSKNSDK